MPAGSSTSRVYIAQRLGLRYNRCGRWSVKRTLALLVLSGVTGVFGGQAQAEEFAWKTDLAQARAKAKEESRPLLVVFR